jgi:hypothetical protein
MEDQANGVVHPLMLREGTVPALMGQDPDASAVRALPEPVDGPQSKGQASWNSRMVDQQCCICQAGHHQHVRGKVSACLQRGAFEAVLGNAVP